MLVVIYILVSIPLLGILFFLQRPNRKQVVAFGVVPRFNPVARDFVFSTETNYSVFTVDVAAFQSRCSGFCFFYLVVAIVACIFIILFGLFCFNPVARDFVFSTTRSQETNEANPSFNPVARDFVFSTASSGCMLRKLTAGIGFVSIPLLGILFFLQKGIRKY